MKKRKICLMSENGDVLDMLSITELDIKEQYINYLSSNKYGNNNPCAIIRSKIMGKFYFDFNDYINEHINNFKTKMTIEELPDKFKDNILWNKNVKYISLY